MPDSVTFDSYLYKTDWDKNENNYRNDIEQSALMAYPGYQITSQTVTCPVDGVYDPDVMLVRFVLDAS